MKNEKVVSKYFFLESSFFSNTLSIKYALSVLFNLYMFIVLFDVTRDGFFLPHIVNLAMSAIRDVSIYSLIIYILVSKKGKLLSKYNIFVIFMIFIPIVMNITKICIGDFIEEGQNINFVIQFSILFAKSWLFLFVLHNLEVFYVFNKSNVMHNFIVIVLFIILFSFTVYFFLPGLRTRYIIANRVGLGNMSVQTGIYFSAFLLTFYFQPFATKFRNAVAIFLFIIAIILSVTSTGIVSLLLALVCFLFDKRTKRKSIMIILFSSICIITIVIIYYDKFEPFFKYFWKKAEEFWDLFINLFNKKNHVTKSSSFGAREKQIAKFKESLTLDNCIFGFGYFSQTTEMIENGYYAVFHDYGLYGLGIMLLILIRHGIWALIDFFKNKSILRIISVLGVCLYCVTLSVAIIPSMATAFMILFYYSFYEEWTI